MTRSLQTMGLSLLFALSLAACGKKDAAPGSVEEQQAYAAAESGESDPCSLLEPKEVEAVMGPLAGPPFRASENAEAPETSDSGDACVYETPDFRTIQLSVVWEAGSMAYKAITLPGRMMSGVSGDDETAPAVSAGKMLLPGGVQIAGEWDEASSWGCCTIHALRGDQLVTFDYRGWRADTPRAVELLNQALLRLDKPLKVDGNAGRAAAVARAKLRPARRPACELLQPAELEAIVGPLANAPKPQDGGDDTTCVIRYTQQESKDSPFKELPPELQSMMKGTVMTQMGMATGPTDTGINIRWRGGFRQLNESALVAGGIDASMEGVRGMPARKAGPITGGPWQEAQQTSTVFTAVKNDVAVTIDTLPMLDEAQVEVRRRIVAKVIEKI